MPRWRWSCGGRSRAGAGHGVSATRRKVIQGAIAGALSAAGSRHGQRRTGPVDRQRRLSQFSYVVVLMLENRSFDNLLGGLYAPGELPPGKPFEGLIGKELSNPIPPGVPTPAGGPVPVLNADQLSRSLSRPGRGLRARQHPALQHRFAAAQSPRPLPATAPMTGFVTDYILNYPTGLRDPPTYDQYSVIMACFPRDPVSILSSSRNSSRCLTTGSARCRARPGATAPSGTRPTPGAMSSTAAGTTRAASNGSRTASGRRCSTPSSSAGSTGGLLEQPRLADRPDPLSGT